IEATPVEFVWHHGDGTSRTTAEPGAPYPAHDITHRYASATDEPLAPRVDVTYRARFRVADGPWRPISETVTVTAPPGSLLVSEATPVLTRGPSRADPADTAGTARVAAVWQWGGDGPSSARRHGGLLTLA